MVDAKDFYSGNFLKAEDCKGGEVVTFIDGGTVEEIVTPEGKAKTVLNFQVEYDGKEKTFTPNKGNGNILVEAFGEDSEKWVGKQFKITLTKVKVFGKVKDSIIVEPQDVIKTEVPGQKK
ncbi:hypothetical protein ES703_88845 [subsurface metagenome]